MVLAEVTQDRVLVPQGVIEGEEVVVEVVVEEEEMMVILAEQDSSLLKNRIKVETER